MAFTRHSRGIHGMGMLLEDDGDVREREEWAEKKRSKVAAGV